MKLLLLFTALFTSNVMADIVMDNGLDDPHVPQLSAAYVNYNPDFIDLPCLTLGTSNGADIPSRNAGLVSYAYNARLQVAGGFKLTILGRTGNYCFPIGNWDDRAGQLDLTHVRIGYAAYTVRMAGMRDGLSLWDYRGVAYNYDKGYAYE